MGPLGPQQPKDMHLLLAFATFIGAATAMPMVYYPAQYIPADEVLVRMPRQLPPQTPHMALHRWGVSRSRPTVVPPRVIMTLRPGATITLSLRTSRFTIREICGRKPQSNSQSFIHSSTVESIPAN